MVHGVPAGPSSREGKGTRSLFEVPYSKSEVFLSFCRLGEAFCEGESMVLVPCWLSGDTIYPKFSTDGEGLIFQAGEKAIMDVWAWLVNTMSVARLDVLEPESMEAARQTFPKWKLDSPSTCEIWPIPPVPPDSGAATSSSEHKEMEDVVKALRKGNMGDHVDLFGHDECSSADEDEIDTSLEDSILDMVKGLKRKLQKARQAAAKSRKAKVKVVQVRLKARKRPAAALAPAVAPAPAAAPEPAAAPQPPPPAPDPPPPPPPPPPAPLPGGRRPRVLVGEPWGEFQLAPVYQTVGGDRVHKAWGASCHKHSDVGEDNRCQKQVTFPPGSSAATRQEAKRLCKVWLLWGRAVPSDAPDGKRQHLFDMGGRRLRSEAPPISEAELDVRVLDPAARL